MKNIFLAIVLFVAIFILSVADYDNSSVVVYDCTLSEISPDYPVKVKEECRRLRQENNKQKTRIDV